MLFRPPVRSDRKGKRPAVESARKANSVAESEEKAADKGKGKAKAAKVTPKALKANTVGDLSDEEKPRKNAYSAELIKQLGFDPTAKDGRTGWDANIQNKVRGTRSCCSTDNG